MTTLISLRAAPVRCSRLASSASHRSGYITARSRSSSTSRTPLPPPYHVLFCGTDSFAATILQGLHRSPSIAQSITVAVPAEQKYHSATKEGSRRRAAASAVAQPPVLDYAHRHDLPAIRVTDFKNDDLPLPGSSSSPLLVTASFGKLVPAWLLDLYPSPSLTLNVHPSLLPDLRGAAPIQWAIARGYEKTGVSIQQLGRGTFDQGDLLAQEKVDLPIDGGRTAAYAEVERLLAQASSELLVDTLASLPQRHVAANIQDGTKATLAPKIKAEHGCVDWENMSAKEIEARHRGFGHQINLCTYLHRSDSPQAVRTLLLDVHLVPSTASLPERAKVLRDDPQYPSGTAVFAPSSPHASDREVIYVKTTARQEGEAELLAVSRLMCAGKAEQATLRDWWRGYGRPKGEMPLLRFVSHDNGGIAGAASSGQKRMPQLQRQQQMSRTTAATASIASSSSATLIGQQMRAFSSRAAHRCRFSQQRAYSTRPPQPPPSPSSFNTASMTPNTSPTAPPPRPPRRRGTIYKLTGDGLSWSQLHPVQKVFRTGEKGGQLTVVVLGTALTAAVLWALLSDMFAPNSPSVIFKDACGRVERCEEIYHHLLPPLRFHLHPTPSFTSSPNPTNPIIGALGGGSGSTHRGSHLPPTRVVREERTGKEVLHMRFYIEARDKERDWTYAEKGRQGVRDGWEWMRTQLGEAWESLTKGVEGGAQQRHHHEEMSRAEAEARGQASASSSGPSVVGRILSSLSFLPASKSSSSSGKANRREPGTFATGEAHVEMVRNVGSNDIWQYRRVMVDVPKSGTLGATRVWVVKREGEVVR